MTLDLQDGVVEVALTLEDWAQLHAGLDAWARQIRGPHPEALALAAKYRRIADAVYAQIEGAIARGDVR